jgi:hypothetical protein
MPKYMINICYGDINKRKASQNPTDGEFVMKKYAEWSQRMGAQIRAAHKLKDGSGRRLELHGGKVSDGPYIETKESIGGFYVIEAKNYKEASALASECPTLLYQGGYVEVREVEI